MVTIRCVPRHLARCLGSVPLPPSARAGCPRHSGARVHSTQSVGHYILQFPVCGDRCGDGVADSAMTLFRREHRLALRSARQSQSEFCFLLVVLQGMVRATHSAGRMTIPPAIRSGWLAHRGGWLVLSKFIYFVTIQGIYSGGSSLQTILRTLLPGSTQRLCHLPWISPGKRQRWQVSQCKPIDLSGNGDPGEFAPRTG